MSLPIVNPIFRLDCRQLLWTAYADQRAYVSETNETSSIYSSQKMKENTASFSSKLRKCVPLTNSTLKIRDCFRPHWILWHAFKGLCSTLCWDFGIKMSSKLSTETWPMWNKKILLVNNEKRQNSPHRRNLSAIVRIRYQNKCHVIVPPDGATPSISLSWL